MPFINTKTNIIIKKEQEQRIKERFGEVISLIPGKSENWLMLNFEPQCRMYFKGDSSKPLAFLEVKIYGGASAQDYNTLTGTLTKIITEELDIAPDCVYVKYEPVQHWGWNGSNF